MMTKNSNTKKSTTMARVALGATAVLALAGHAHAAATTCTGASGVYNTENNLAVSSAADACRCVEGYVAADGTTYAGATSLSCVRCDDGYYVSTLGGAGTLTANGVCSKIPTDHYVVKNAGVTGMLASVTTIEVPLACPTNSEIDYTSNSGTALADCQVKAGYYLHTGSTTASSVVIKQVTSGFYSTGGEIVSSTTSTDAIASDTLTHLNVAVASTSNVNACPYAGTSPAGATTSIQCTADCSKTYPDSGAANAIGGCGCARGFYGTAVDRLSSSDYPASTGCTACSKSFASAVEGSVTTMEIGAGNAVGDCVTAPGYILTEPNSVSINAIVTAKAPANSYAAGGTAMKTTTTTPDEVDWCPEFSTSAAGSSAITDCKCVAGYVSTASTCEPCAGRAAGDSVGTHNTCTTTANTPSTSGASGASVFAALSAVAAAQLVL